MEKGNLIILIIGIILIIISAISLIFGYLIRELWPTTNKIYEIGIPAIIGTLGVIFIGAFGVIFVISQGKKKPRRKEEEDKELNKDDGVASWKEEEEKHLEK